MPENVSELILRDVKKFLDHSIRTTGQSSLSKPPFIMSQTHQDMITAFILVLGYIDLKEIEYGRSND